MHKHLVVPVLLTTLLSMFPSTLRSSVSSCPAAYISGVTEPSEINVSETDTNLVKSNDYGSPLLDPEIEDRGAPLLEAEVEDTGAPLLDAIPNDDGSLYADASNK